MPINKYMKLYNFILPINMNEFIDNMTNRYKKI